VLSQDGVVAWSPRVARLPYEVAVAPEQAEPDGLTSNYLAPALRVLADLVRRLHKLEGAVPLNAWLHNHESGWRLVLLPRLSIIAGLELGGCVWINTLPPEDAADRLRNTS